VTDLETRPLLLSYRTVFDRCSQTIRAYVGVPNICGRRGPAAIGWGREWPLEIRSSPHVLLCQIWLVHVRHYDRNDGDPPEKFDPRVSPFKVTQGPRNRHGSIGHL